VRMSHQRLPTYPHSKTIHPPAHTCVHLPTPSQPQPHHNHTTNHNQIRSASEVEVISLNDPAACIRSASRIAGALVVWDDGSLKDLSALANLKRVDGPVVVFGVDGASGLQSLAGLENLEVRRVSVLVVAPGGGVAGGGGWVEVSEELRRHTVVDLRDGCFLLLAPPPLQPSIHPPQTERGGPGCGAHQQHQEPGGPEQPHRHCRGPGGYWWAGGCLTCREEGGGGAPWVGSA